MMILLAHRVAHLWCPK